MHQFPNFNNFLFFIFISYLYNIIICIYLVSRFFIYLLFQFVLNFALVFIYVCTDIIEFKLTALVCFTFYHNNMRADQLRTNILSVASGNGFNIAPSLPELTAATVSQSAAMENCMRPPKNEEQYFVEIISTARTAHEIAACNELIH